jgi:hypothetical protein
MLVALGAGLQLEILLKSLSSNFTLPFLPLSSQVSPSWVTVGVPTALFPLQVITSPKRVSAFL